MPRSDLPPGVAINHWPDWGWCGVAASVDGIAAVEFAQTEPKPIIDRLTAVLAGRTSCPARAARGLSAIGKFLDGQVPPAAEFNLLGTDFQKRVWAELLKVGPGTTVSYAQLARALGLSGGYARAVGAAVGANPAPPLVPCHRVLPAGGGIGGYRLGKQLKVRLLALEGRSGPRQAPALSG